MSALAKHDSPSSLVLLDAAYKRFGHASVDLLVRMVELGDPLADAADAEPRRHGEGARR